MNDRLPTRGRSGPLRQARRQLAPRGFTLVELLVVISILLILSVMTIYSINLSLTSERVRSGARQVQSVLEGAKDRAVHAGELRGVRLLVNEEITEAVDGNEINTVATTLVYVAASGTETSREDRLDVNENGEVSELFSYVQFPDPQRLDEFSDSGGQPLPPDAPIRRAIIGTNTNWTDLAARGLLNDRSVIEINGCRYRIDGRGLPIPRDSTLYSEEPPYGGMRNSPYEDSAGRDLGAAQANAANPFEGGATHDEVLYLLPEPGDCWPQPPDPAVVRRTTIHAWNTAPQPFSLELSPDVMSGEEPSALPQNVCIDLETSHLPPSWIRYNPATGGRQFSDKMEILFSPNGGVVGEAASAGMIHLHVCHVADAMDNVPPGSQTIDGTPEGQARNGEEFGITIFTSTGRVITHPIDWSGYPVPGNKFHELDYDDNPEDFDNNPATKGYWQPGASYNDGEIVAPRIYNGNVYRVVPGGGGNSGSDEPAWNTAPGGLTADNEVTWVAVKHNVWRAGREGEVAR